MKVIPSATVSSKFFSVSANTVPCRGGKSLSSNASPRAEQGQLWSCRNTNRSSLCCRARSRTNSQLACHKPHEKGPRFTAGSPGPGSRRCSEEVVGPALRRPQPAERVPVQLLPSGALWWGPVGTARPGLLPAAPGLRASHADRRSPGPHGPARPTWARSVSPAISLPLPQGVSL